MTLDEIKRRQLANQYLIISGEKITVARDLLGFQAQFMANALHSMRLRCRDYDEASAGDGLVKNWTVRGTVHVFAESDLPLFKNCGGGKSYRLDEWRGYVHHLTGEWTLTPERQKYFAHIILDSLRDGVKTREELKAICRESSMTPTEEGSMFNQWGGGIGELCSRGFINYVVREKKAYCLCPEYEPMEEERANLELAMRYFTNYAPATIHDAQYFFHATAKRVREWLDRLPVESSECGGRTFFHIPSGRSDAGEIPGCVFLAGFDQLMLGHEKKESLYLAPEHLRYIYNLAGIVMPPVLLRGKVAGKWRLKNGALTVTAFIGLSPRDKELIAETAGRLWPGLKKLIWE